MPQHSSPQLSRFSVISFETSDDTGSLLGSSGVCATSPHWYAFAILNVSIFRSITSWTLLYAFATRFRTIVYHQLLTGVWKKQTKWYKVEFFFQICWCKCTFFNKLQYKIWWKLLSEKGCERIKWIGRKRGGGNYADIKTEHVTPIREDAGQLWEMAAVALPSIKKTKSPKKNRKKM